MMSRMLRGVEQDHKGLSQGLQLRDDPLLRLQVVLPWNIGDGAVGGDDYRHGGVLLNNLSGADLRCLRHGHLPVRPGGHHHPGRPVLELPHGPLDHIAYTVDEPHGKGGAPLQGDLHRLLGDELGLRRHDGPAAAGLGQLVDGPLPAIDVVDVGDDTGLHKSLDKGGFPCPHRPQHPHKEGPASPCGNILVDVGVRHNDLPCAAARRILIW